MLIVVTGGGTGGHIYPGLAVSARLLHGRPGVSILFVGSSKGPEGQAASQAGIPFEGLSLSGLVGKSPAKRIRAAFQFAAGTVRCLLLFRRLRPACVLGTGGYAAAPACLAAALLRIPLVLHEMNMKPGLVTRLLSRRAGAVACAFEETVGMLPSGARAVVTGVAVRPEIEVLADEEQRRSRRLEGHEAFRLEDGRRTLLVFGGSQGAGALNSALWDLLESYSDRSDLQVLHIVGRREYGDERRVEAEKRLAPAGLLYRALEYWERMDLAYAVADLALTRSGAGTIAELVAAGVPALLVPFPHAAGGHQEGNAERLARAGAAVLVLQRGDDAKDAITRAFDILEDSGSLEKMLAAAKGLERPPGTQGFMGLIEELTSGSREGS